MGDGFPDLVVARNGINVLVEVKDGSKPPSKQKLTKDQEEFHASWKGWIAVVTCIADVEALNARVCEGYKSWKC